MKQKHAVRNEDSPEYLPSHDVVVAEDSVIQEAIHIVRGRLNRLDFSELTSPQMVKDYLMLKFALLEHEEFHMILLDNRHRVITCQFMFRGTIDGASVHPREVVKEALKYNAAAVILTHNHPSGLPEPSKADIALTRKLVDALGLIDVRVLDHIVIGGTESVSFAERGLI